MAARSAVAAVTGCGHASPTVPGMPAPGTPTAMPARALIEYSLQSPRRLAPNNVKVVPAASSGVSSTAASPRRAAAQPQENAARRFRLAAPTVTPAASQTAAGHDSAAASSKETVAASEALCPGAELVVGYLHLRCAEMLGSGSYSTVWRADVTGQRSEGIDEVALKDVFCRGKSALQQSLFEVQLLMAVERRAGKSGDPQKPRLPRCLAYQVDPSDMGWNVRMALTRLKGDQLDGWLQKAASSAVAAQPQESWVSQIRKGCSLARRLLQQLGPTLDTLAPLAWHRDVNSHNVLVCNDGTKDGVLSVDDVEDASFWLCDLGLAVDSQSWTSAEDCAWRVTDIGGDCRYWPASCWMVHCYGAEYLEERPAFCRQYKHRLDIHALGITAMEVICSAALAVRAAGAACKEGEDPGGCWSWLLDTWQRYHETVSAWWQAIYSVFTSGGDFRPVHAWLVDIAAPDKVTILVSDLRLALCTCATACGSDQALARLLRAVAELADESSTLELAEICKLAGTSAVKTGLDAKSTGAHTEDKPRADQDTPSRSASSYAAADMAAGRGESQEPQPIAEEKHEQAHPRSADVSRGSRKYSGVSDGESNGNTNSLKEKLEDERSQHLRDLEQLKLHRSRVLRAQMMLCQMP